MFDSDFLAWVWLGAVVLSVVTFLIGALIPANRPRRLSDGLMIGGAALFVFGIAFALVLLLAGNRWHRGNYELLEKLALADAFTIPCALLALSAGFLLSRLEIRRARLQAELHAQVPRGMPYR